MSAVLQPRYTYEQYLAREEAAEYRSEFYRGEIFAMAGGSPRHSEIAINISTSLRGKLRGAGCRPYGSDLRIRVAKNGLATYPDVSVVCGELQLHADDQNAITNPKVIFEVLSKSTESYDRGKKFDLYRDLESLQEYVLVSQTEPLVERYVRQPDESWNLTVFKGLEAILDLPSVACSLPLAEIYEDVTFGPEEATPDVGVQS
jgi:Uma2 family endonuclease